MGLVGGIVGLQWRRLGVQLSLPYTMQLAACNRITSEMLRVACSVKLFHANRIVVYSLHYCVGPVTCNHGYHCLLHSYA